MWPPAAPVRRLDDNMNILVTNVYSWRNKGDAAIVLAMLEHLEDEFPGANISLSTYDLDDKDKYGPYPCYGAFLTLLRRAGREDHDSILPRLRCAMRGLSLRVSLSCFFLLRNLHISSYWLLPATLAAKLRTYEEADLVVACGGGYLLTTGRARLLERLLGYNHLRFISMDFCVAMRFSKPFILYNQSVGPFFAKTDAMLAAHCLRSAALVICREPLTYDRLRAMGLTNIELSADAAFGLKPVPCGILDGYGFSRQHTNVGLTIRRCLPDGKQKDFENELVRFVELLAERHPEVRFYFMPQVTYTQVGDDDREIAERVRGRLSERSKRSVATVTEDLHPGELKHIIAQMNYFIGTRMHSNIFALSSMVKTLAIAYEPKTTGIMQMLGLEAYVTVADGLNHVSLIALWDCLVHDPEYIATLKRKIPEVQQSARMDLRRLLRTHIPRVRRHPRPDAGRTL